MQLHTYHHPHQSPGHHTQQISSWMYPQLKGCSSYQPMRFKNRVEALAIVTVSQCMMIAVSYNYCCCVVNAKMIKLHNLIHLHHHLYEMYVTRLSEYDENQLISLILEYQ